MYYKPYGSVVHLEPLQDRIQCNRQSSCYWLLPDRRTRLDYPLTDAVKTKYSLSSNGTLTIADIQQFDNGIYHFFHMNRNDWIVSKSLLNIRGAPFDSFWSEYWPNVSIIVVKLFFKYFLCLLTY
jgi:hypothetical protein